MDYESNVNIEPLADFVQIPLHNAIPLMVINFF